MTNAMPATLGFGASWPARIDALVERLSMMFVTQMRRSSTYSPAAS